MTLGKVRFHDGLWTSRGATDLTLGRWDEVSASDPKRTLVMLETSQERLHD